MSEDERLEMVGTVAEAHSDLREIALRLRRRLPANAAVARAALRTEQEAFRLKLELQRLTISEAGPAPRRGPQPEGRRGGTVIDIERLRRNRLAGEES